jgi:hypothetical protein
MGFYLIKRKPTRKRLTAVQLKQDPETGCWLHRAFKNAGIGVAVTPSKRRTRCSK